MAYLDHVHDVDLPMTRHWHCRLLIFFVYYASFCSSYLLIAMTFERFYSIIQPHEAASFNTVKKAKKAITSIYVFVFLYCSPYFFFSGNNGTFCVGNRFASDNVWAEFYHWLTEIVMFFFPFASLLIMNSVIIHTLRKRSKLSILGKDQNEGHQLKSSEKQIITMLLLVTFVFLILNIPTRTMVYYLNVPNKHTPYYYASFHLCFQVGEKTYYTNHGINFFLYVMSGKKFRTDLKKLFVSKRSNITKQSVSDGQTKSSVVFAVDN